MVYIQHTTDFKEPFSSSLRINARERSTQSVENICRAGTWGQEIVFELAASGNASTAASREPVLTPAFGVEKSRRLGAWGCRPISASR